jgi:hypothetical protein
MKDCFSNAVVGGTSLNICYARVMLRGICAYSSTIRLIEFVGLWRAEA